MKFGSKKTEIVYFLFTVYTVRVTLVGQAQCFNFVRGKKIFFFLQIFVFSFMIIFNNDPLVFH